MTANSDKSKQNNKTAHRVLAGVLCGASVLSLVLSLVMPPISQAIANDTQTVSTEETVTGGGSSSEPAAVGNTSEDAENQNSAAISASAATTVDKGIYKPTSIGIGTDVGSSKNDPGVATYVGRDMYIGSNPSDAKTLIGQDVIDNNMLLGSYAVEAEGLTVVAGKLAMRPLKESWGGKGFRFGTVGFGSQFRPESGTALAVAGINTALTSIGTASDATGSVAAWNKGAWTGKSTDNKGVDYDALISGNRTYVYGGTVSGKESVVCAQNDTTDSSNKIRWQQTDVLNNINGNSYAEYGTYLTTLSDMLKGFNVTGEVNACGFAESNSNYEINKYDYNNKAKYTLRFDGKYDGNYKPVTGALDTRIPNNEICNTERLITFTGDGTSMQQVFTIDGSELSNLKNGIYYRGVDFNFDKIPEGASVIVNVTGEAPIEFHNGWRFWWNGSEISRGYEDNSAVKTQYSTAAQSIMWNFMDTTSLTIRGGIAGEGRQDWGGKDDKWTDDDPAAAMIGSILVPKGSFDCHVTTNGRVYVGEDFMMNNPQVAYNFDIEGESSSVIDMDQERHNFPWSGTYTPDGSAVAWSKVDAADDKPLAGSEWAIYATEDNARSDQHRIVSIVDNGKNDSDPAVGTIQFNHLNQKANIGDSGDTKYFTYYIREVKAPEGYELSSAIYTSKMFHTGDELNLVGNVDANGNEISSPQSAIANTKITGTVSWTKVEEGDTGHTPLAGSEWKLAKLGADGSTEEEFWTVSDQSDSGEITWKDIDGTSGKFTLEGLQPGTYTLVETQAPFGYELNKNTYKFTVDSTNGSITWKENERPSIVSGTTYISDKCSATSVKIPVTKSVRNTDWPKDDEGGYVPFEFSIVATGDYAAKAPMPEAPKISVAPKAGETEAAKLNNITATFGAMTFNKSHLSTEADTNKDYAKTYTYTVKEVAPTTGAIDKLRYSKAEYQVAVTVKAVMLDGKYSGLTTSTTVTQMKDDMGNTLGENGQGVAVQTSAGADPTIIPVSTFTNTYSTTLPLSGMSGVTVTYLAGAAVLCAAAAWMHIRRKANAKGGERRE